MVDDSVKVLGIELCAESREAVARHVVDLLCRVPDEGFVSNAERELGAILEGVRQSQANIARMSVDCGLDIEADDWPSAYRLAFNRIVQNELWSRLVLAFGGVAGALLAAGAGCGPVTQTLTFAAGSLAAVLAVSERAVRISRLCTS